MFDGTGKIDAGHHGKLAHHGCFAGDRQRVFIIEGGKLDANGDIARRQVRFVQFF